MRNLSLVPALVLCVLACSSPKSDPHVVLSSPASSFSPSTAALLAEFEGSFDATTGQLSIRFYSRDHRALLAESIVYGTTPGDAYLHTEGTNADGRSDPPSYDPSTQILTATVDAENGTGAPLSAFTATITSLSPPASVGMVTGGSTSCSGASLGSGASAGPCTVSYGVVAPDATFPAPDLTSAQAWTFYLASGTSFTFAGSLTGSTSPACGGACNAGEVCSGNQCVCDTSGTATDCTNTGCCSPADRCLVADYANCQQCAGKIFCSSSGDTGKCIANGACAASCAGHTVQCAGFECLSANAVNGGNGPSGFLNVCSSPGKSHACQPTGAAAETCGCTGTDPSTCPGAGDIVCRAAGGARPAECFACTAGFASTGGEACKGGGTCSQALGTCQ